MGALGLFFAAIAVILALLVYFVRRKYAYWSRMGVGHENPVFPYGNLKGIGKQFHQSEVMQRLYNKLKATGVPFVGLYFFFSPVVLVTSLDFVKTVLVKDASSFVDRGAYYNEEDDPLSAHLFNIDSPKWKSLRTKLTPTFTSGKMKMMFGTVVDVAEKLIKTLALESSHAAGNDLLGKLGPKPTENIYQVYVGLTDQLATRLHRHKLNKPHLDKNVHIKVPSPLLAGFVENECAFKLYALFGARCENHVERLGLSPKLNPGKEYNVYILYNRE